jgi:NDP-sugar pyrophosphorylase family protein
MKAFILSGGFGSKLREVIYNQPKILAPIKGQAFIDHLFYNLKKHGFTEVIMGLGYLAEQVKSYMVHRPLYDLNLIFSVEPSPLGTGGALKHASKYLDSTFFVINGDTYLDCDYAKALKFHQSSKALVTLVTAKNEFASGFGQVKVNTKKQVTKFASNPNVKKGESVHAGVYIVEPSVLDKIKSNQKTSFEKEILPKLIKNEKVYAYASKSSFFDIGKTEGYKLAQEKLQR